MLEVDKLFAVIFIIVIKGLSLQIHHIINMKGHRLYLANWEVLDDLYSASTNTCKSCKIHNLASRFRAQPCRCEKFQSQNFEKIKFHHSYFIFVTYLPREVDGELPAKSVVSIRLGESLLNIIRCCCMLEKPGTVSNSLNTPVPGSQKFSSNFYKKSQIIRSLFGNTKRF